MIALKTEGNVIKKRKQKLVKHKRKNWKKTDLTEIEKAIEDVKHEERTGYFKQTNTFIMCLCILKKLIFKWFTLRKDK